jgi:carbamoyl-phosphate synthase large subunit
LFDIDIPVLAASADRFRAIGVEPVVSSPEVAAVCNDKWATHEFLLRNGIGSPRTWLTLAEAQTALNNGELDFPVIVKPRWGMGSIAVHMAYDAAELVVFHARVQREVQASYLRHESQATPESVVLIQERLNGVEHGLDVVNDLHGDHCATIVKRKLAMRSGETDSAVTVDEPRLVELGARLAALLRHHGNLDVDVFLEGDKVHVLEMNARFGGGYPFSHLAGVDVPRAIVHWLRGDVAPRDLFLARIGTIGVKCIDPVEWKRA